MSLNRQPKTRRRSVRQFLQTLILGEEGPAEPKRGRLLLESLERRQLLAGDVELLFTDGAPDESVASRPSIVSASNGLSASGQAEGELAPDLLQFAKQLTDAGVKFYGAHWCPFCSDQKELFADGGDDLPFIEVTEPDRTLNSIGQSEQITSFPTWEFQDGTRLEGLVTLETLSQRSGIAIPQSETPTFAPIGDLTVQQGSPLHIPIDAYDPDGGPLTVTVTVGDENLLLGQVISGNRSIRIDMDGYGDMVFEMFEQRAPTASGRVIELAEAGFYDGIIFHRIADDFVIQGGDPTGTGTSGSSLGNFDDDFHPELQHNREGVLSFAKSSDDTNNSQFFITEVPTRFLDFNHSIFGQLVEGFDVRDAISETSTPESRGSGASQKPDNDIVINTIDVFDDTENSVVMLKPTDLGTGTTTVTITVTDGDGNTSSETIQVAVVGDTANSQPFLEVDAPATSPVDTPAELQLASVDVEGDAVTYFAQSFSPAANGTVSVNPNTGLLTVTPASGFTGTIDVGVGVRPGAGVSGNSQSDMDTQTLSFRFEGESVLAPTGVDLQTGSDTGSSNVDNITNAGTLAFLVSGVTDGSVVQLIDTNTNSVIGTGNATGTTIVISTNNIAALGDGDYQIAARQILGNDASELSSAIALTYDNTIPESVVGSAATQGNVGRLYETDLISSEEGSGLVYTLTSAPTGATIDPTTGVVSWTPVTDQLGDNSFTVEMTDLAGNSRSEDFSVSVAAAPVAEIRLEITDLQGNPLAAVSVGQEFLLRMVAVDARAFNKPGVYGAFADILYDSTLIQPVSGATIEYADGFGLVQKGTFSSGLIDELGAVSSSLVASNDTENLIATVRMEAISTGSVNIRSEPADDASSEFLLFGLDDQLPAESVAYGSASLAIGQSFITENDTVTIPEDSGKTVIDVLDNDEFVTGTGTLTVIDVTQPVSGGVVSLEGGVVSFTPESDFNGEAIFTYRVSDSQGIQENASVTVTVSPTNDAPEGVDDTFEVDEDSDVNFLDVLANDELGPDVGETLLVTEVGATDNGGTVSVSANGSGIDYRPAAGFTGTETFTYTVSDGELEDVVTVSVTVVTPDAPPTAVDDSFTIVEEDDDEAEFDLLGNDTRDVDNQDFIIDSLGTPSDGGSVRVSSDGLQFFYEPAEDFEGTETVTYTIRDTGGGLAVGTVTFTVGAVNDVPPVADVNVGASRGTSDNSIFTLDDLPDNVDSGETLTISVTTATSAGGTASVDPATQEIIYNAPSDDFVGEDTVSYTVSDGSGLTSSGTITVQVSDYSPRRISLSLPRIASNSVIADITLTGTDLLGNSVSRSINYGDDADSFEDLMPGDYSIRIPAIPFLQGGSEPTVLSVTSGADEGDEVVESGLGRLKAKFVSIRDWLGSTPRRSILAVVSADTAGSVAALSSNSTLSSPTVELDSIASELIVRGVLSETTDGETTDSDVEASVPSQRDSRAQLRGEIDGLLLYRIATDNLQYTDFTPSSSAEGEQVADDALTAGGQGEGEQIVASNTLTVGDIQAEGESPASAAVTEADLFVPASDQTSTRTDATVMPLEQGDVWIGESLRDDSKANGDSESESIDSAMENVAEELTVVSAAGDAVAEQSEQDAELRAGAVDQVLTSEL